MSFLHDLFQWFSHIEPDDDECCMVTVKKGDSLWAIADSLTGDGGRWHELADANPDRNFSADYVIKPGDTLRIPHSWAA